MRFAPVGVICVQPCGGCIDGAGEFGVDEQRQSSAAQLGESETKVGLIDPGEAVDSRVNEKALEAGDLKAVGTIMTTNHKLLGEMEFSHEILDKMCKSALERGAWGAKVTGGGRGGYMISLTPGQELQDKVASAFEKEGYKVIRATIGGS